VTMNTKTQH